MNNAYKIFKKLIKIFISYLNNHKINEIGVNNKKIHYYSQPIVDLNKNVILEKKNVLLNSYEGDSTFASSNDYPIIETWVKIDNISYANNDMFVYEQYKKLKATKNKNKIIIEEDIYLLPYYTSHFGHFTGDLLGQMLYFINLIKNEKSNRKLLITSPSIKWDNFLKDISNDKILFFSPKQLLSNNYLIKNGTIFPRLSTTQNIILAKNILNGLINFNKVSPKKIFLTTDRNDRISNIKELKKFLINENFEIIISNNYEINELLSIIKSADIVITEKASILNNVILIRNSKYIILSSITETNLSKKLFFGAGIYKEFDRGIYKEIFCEDDPVNQNVRAFKKRIYVNINKLKKILNDEFY